MSKPTQAAAATAAAKTTPPANPPLAAVSLNDENWNTHVFAIFPDDKMVTTASVQPLYDLIASGYRAKFSILQKSALMAWYAENSKLDICKEFKSAIDAANGNEADIPDLAMAKLIKCRLLLLKQEGIDAKNAVIAARALTTPPGTQTLAAEPPKGAAKPAAAKEAAARAKSPAKKPPAGGGKNDKKAAPEPVAVAPPESAEEASKRKNKLREKGAKSEVKIQSIGDEPADGPDAYILLKDFTSMGIFNSLMEECDIKIHTLFRIMESTDPPTPPVATRLSPATTTPSTPNTNSSAPSTPSPFPVVEIKTLDSATVPSLSSLNRLLVEAREWCNTATDDSLWRNIAWCALILPTTTTTAIATTPPAALTAGTLAAYDPKQAFDALAHRIYAQLKSRALFAEFYDLDKPVVVGTAGTGVVEKNEVRNMSSLMDVMPYASLLATEAVLGVVVDQTMRILKAEEEAEVGGGMEPVSVSSVDEMGGVVNYLDKMFKKLNLTKGVGLDGVDDTLKSSRYGDTLTTTKHILGDLPAFGINVPELIANLITVYPSIQKPKGPIGQQLSSRPSTAAAEADPSIAAAADARSRQRVANLAILRHSTSDGAFHAALRVLLQNQIQERLVQTASESSSEPLEQGGEVWDLNEWDWEETLDASTLAQVLLDAKTTHPVVATKYCDKTGKLLVALTGYGGVGVKKYDGTSLLHVPTKVNFGLFHELNDRFKNYLTLPPKTRLERPPIYYSGDSVVQRKDNYTALYPSDGGHIVVHREQHLNFKHEIRTNLVSADNNLTWSSAAQNKPGLGSYVTAVFENNLVFCVTEKEAAAGGRPPSATLSCPDGLMIEFRSNGSIVQKYDSVFSAAANEHLAGRGQPVKELSRVIMPDGTIIRYLSNSTTELLLPNGTTSMCTKDVWITTNPDGTRTQTTPTTGETISLRPIRFAKESIIALSEVILTREDMVVSTTKKDGSLVAQHADGTVITSQAVAWKVEEVVEPVSTSAVATPVPTRPASAALTQLYTAAMVFGIPTIVSPPMKPDAFVVTIEKPESPKYVVADSGNKVTIRLMDGTTVEQTNRTQYKIFNDIHTFEFETNTQTGDSQFTLLHNHSKKPNPTQQPHTASHSFNWLNGTFDSTDSTGTNFSISPTGECTVTDPEPTTTPTTTSTPHVTDITSPEYIHRLVTSPPATSVTSPRNPPKLFIIQDDGSGVQLLRDADLLAFFKDQMRNPHTEVLEDAGAVGDGVGLFVTVVGKPVGSVADATMTPVFYRQLLKCPPLNAEMRTNLSRDVQTFLEIAAKMQVSPAPEPQGVSDAGVSGGTDAETSEAADQQQEQPPIVLGRDRLKTQEEIMQLYKLHKTEIGTRTRPTVPTKNMDMNVWKIQNAIRDHIQRSQ
ncbi:Sperm-associated antigen 17 [Podochytrium sp. JEL0797]|nr:Sperm-associated antigen 17 [Podochytrium sp. JEL0797]